MADSNNEMKAIEKISGVVGESQVKIILSNQCIKAQAFLVNRLKRRFERQKEVSKFISNDNMKLEAEIKNAEQEIKSLMLAHESIKSANVELKKEWQLAKENSQETRERIQIGEKKYDELWEQAKSRYESIGFVQNWLQATKKKEVLEEDINVLDKEIRGLLEEIKSEEDIVSALNRKRIIELAEYIVHEKPMIENNISILSQEIEKINGQIKQLTERQVAPDVQNKSASDLADASPRTRALKLKIDDGWPNLNKNLTSNVNTLMPKLQLMNIDLDVMSVKLDQIKKSDFATTTSPLKKVNSDQKTLETGLKLSLTPDKQHNEYSSQYFNKSDNTSNNANITTGENEKNHSYSKRKLINILEDIKLDKRDTYHIVSKVNMDNLQGVSVITANADKNNEIPLESKNEKANEAPDAKIEELDLTSNVDQVILPPSGFLDQLRSSQEQKKRVSFELPASEQQLSLDPKTGNPAGDENVENEANVTINSPMDDTAGSEESFTKIKDMILKKHNLDLSPPFVYGKNTPMHLKSDEIVRSNYFKLSCEEPQPSTSGTQAEIVELPNEADDNEMECDEPVQTGPINEIENEAEDNNVEMDVEENIIRSAKETQEKHVAKPVAGLLFSHGPLGLPDSLDVSISTTGFEDGDPDYPQYSSLLLSPKADLPIPSTNENVEVISQDVPNFLSGLRKTGLSFFGNMVRTNTDTENASAPAGNNNFNFAFGGDDKKSRGGLFNMFN